jgi:hypothetical protein
MAEVGASGNRVIGFGIDAGAEATEGRVKCTVVPSPGSLSNHMSPPCCLTKFRTM